MIFSPPLSVWLKSVISFLFQIDYRLVGLFDKFIFNLPLNLFCA